MWIIDKMIWQIENYGCDCHLSIACLLSAPIMTERHTEMLRLHDVYLYPTIHSKCAPMDIFANNFARIEYLKWLKEVV